jgi:hypothetical protein
MNNSSFLSYFKNNLILYNDQTKSIRIRNYNQTKEHDIFLLPSINTDKAKLSMSYFLPSFLNFIFKSKINYKLLLFKSDLKIIFLLILQIF